MSDTQLSNELKHLVDEAWVWQVVKVSESEFSVRFPSRETLRMSTRSGKIFLPLSQSEAKIREAFLEVRPGKAFPSVWVQISGLPKDLMSKDRIMAALTMIGRPMDVDELSVKKHKTEPIRVRFQCRFPDRIKGSIQLCVNDEPFTIGLVAELGGRGCGGSSSGGPPKPPAPREDDGLEDSEEPSSEIEPRHNRKSKEKQSQNPCGKGSGGSAGGGGSQVLAGSSSAPPLGKGALPGVNQYGSNLLAFSFPSLSLSSDSPLGGCDSFSSLLSVPLGKEIPEFSSLSVDAVSQVDDPDPVVAWLLDSPTPVMSSPAAGVVLPPAAPASLGLQQPSKAL
jgi:hypothetical protein